MFICLSAIKKYTRFLSVSIDPKNWSSYFLFIRPLSTKIRDPSIIKETVTIFVIIDAVVN